jgi:hypothetical protein
MTRKRAVLALAAFHLLLSTWLLPAGMDLLFSPGRPVAAPPDCASCGCADHAAAARTCCCFPHEEATAAAPSPAPSSALDEARCRGVQAALAQALTQPVVCAFAFLPPPVPVREPLAFPEQAPVDSTAATLLDKVPIAQA